MESYHEVIDQILVDVFPALLEAYGLECIEFVEVDRTGGDGLTYAGVIGYTAEKVRGNLVICLPEEVIHKMMPEARTLEGDWAGELANQLLGRMKNRLVPYGVSLSLAIPVSVSGLSFRQPPKPPSSVFLAIKTEVGVVSMSSDSVLSSGFEMQAPTPDSECLPEGESFMF